MPAWKHALFDLDGTLTDPAEGIIKCIEFAFTSLERQSPGSDELRQWIGPPLLNSFAGVLEDRALAQQALDLYRQRFSTIGLFENRLIAGIVPMLERLVEDGVSCFLATSKPGCFARRIISHFGLDQWLHGVYGSELDGTRADKTELLAYLLERESIDPAQTVMIGDRYHDIDGARNNNIQAIGVTWGYGSREELIVAGAHLVIDAPGQLTNCFQRTFSDRNEELA